MSFRQISTLTITLLFIFLSCGQRKGASNSFPIHLVIDAGSSGTRFCLYEVSTANACHLETSGENACTEVPAENGLADLGEEKSVEVIKAGWNAIHPDDRKRIISAALLGTGGFRRATPQRQRAVLERLGGYFRESGLNAVLKVLTGEEEGKLAWRTMEQLHTDSGHNTIETGGATVQISTGSSVSDVRAVSAPVGMNTSFETLKTQEEFKACFGEKTDFDECRAFVFAKVFRDSDIQKFSSSMSGVERRRPLFGMGAPWMSLFQLASRESLDLPEVERLGRFYCSKTVAEIIKRGVPERFAARRCFMISYQTAFLQASGSAEIHQGAESWPPGAAVTHNFFPDCN